MVKPFSTLIAGAILMLLPHQASACGMYFGLYAGEYNPVTGIFSSLGDLALPTLTIKLRHKPSASVDPYGESVVSIGYDRRWFPKV